MNKYQASKFLRQACWLLPMVLSACSNNYRAPVIEAGQRLEVRPPLIVDSSSGDAVLRQTYSPPPSSSRSTTAAAAGTPDTHRVRAGETLFSIAFQYELDYRSLAIANGLNPPFTIFVDQELNLDVSRIGSTNSESAVASAGAESGVARSRAGASRSGVIRSSIDRNQSAPQWQWPAQGEILRRFGEGTGEGIDISGKPGQAVLAAAAGDVVYAGRGVQGAGNLIILRHNDRTLSAYGHNRVMLVSEGRRVAAGEQIAEVGANAAGVPMLHFDIRLDGKSVDPLARLPDR